MTRTPPKHFLSLLDIPACELRKIIDDAHRIKAAQSTLDIKA